jgi:hypothetical protein
MREALIKEHPITALPDKDAFGLLRNDPARLGGTGGEKHACKQQSGQ